jgi:TorA maturation chaperone TorD
VNEIPATDQTTEAAASSGGESVVPEDRLRADTYRVLGRLLASPPDAEALDLLCRVGVGEEDSLLGVAWRLLAQAADRATVPEVADEYQALFIGLGRGELIPYASWYLTGLLMEQPLALLRDDMRRLGFERRDDVREPEDHAGALCEIMAFLVTENDADSLQTQAWFFARHIRPWMPHLFRDMQTARTARFYRAVGQLGEQFIETDQHHLEMVHQSSGPGGPGVS